MPPEEPVAPAAAAATSSSAAAAAEPPGTPPAKPKPRPPAEIERDIGTEREALGASLTSLREQVDATRAKILSPRTYAIVGSAVAGLIALRARRRRKRHRG